MDRIQENVSAGLLRRDMLPPHHSHYLAHRLPRVMLGRVLITSLLLGATLIYQWFRIGDGPLLRLLSPTYGTISFVYAITVFWSYLFRKWELEPGRLDFLAKCQVIIDALTIGFLVAVSGGPSSVFSFLFIVVVIYSGFMLNDRWAFVSAALGSFVHASAVFAVFLYPRAVMRETLGLFFEAPMLPECIYSVFVQTMALFVAGALTSYVAERLQSTGEMLQQSEVALGELEQLHERIVTNLTAGLITTDSSGRVLYANHSAEALLEGGVSGFVGKPVDELVPAFAQVSRENPAGVDRLDVALSGKGGLRYFGLTVTPLRDEGGQPKGNIFIFQDLTQLKRAEEQLKKADRLAAVGELAAGIAHEIRNPLASISGCVQMLKDDLPPDVSSNRLFRIVIREIDRLNGLITEFLQFARPKQLEPAPIDVRTWIEDLAVQFRATAGDSGRLEIDVDPGLREFVADRALITQAIWNLIRNADQALGTGNNGHIVLGIRTSRQPSGQEWLEINISDNGPGIPEDVRSRVFEPFFTTKPEGTGLGLSLVYKIAEMHGGTVDLTTGDQGTRVTMSIPPLEPLEGTGDESTDRIRAV